MAKSKPGFKPAKRGAGDMEHFKGELRKNKPEKVKVATLKFAKQKGK